MHHRLKIPLVRTCVEDGSYGFFSQCLPYPQYQVILFCCISESLSTLAILPAKFHCYMTLVSLVTMTGGILYCSDNTSDLDSHCAPESHKFSLFSQYSCSFPKFRRLIFLFSSPATMGFPQGLRVTVFVALLPTV